MNVDLIHFDTIYSQYVQPQNDPFNCKFNLIQPLKCNAKRIFLKSLEMPININNIRNVSTMNLISMTVNLGSTYLITISEANYPNIASLLNAINTAFIGVIPSTTITFSVNATNNIVITATSSTITSFILNPTILSTYFLGFRNNTFSGLVATSRCQYLLNVDNYINLYFQNVPTESTANNVLCSFKIPLNAVNGQILFVGENTTFVQPLQLFTSNQSLSTIQVVVYDRFNNQILAGNQDYSFTLAVEYE